MKLRFLSQVLAASALAIGSDDEGASWARVNDDAHQFAWINSITGDPRVYGRVYIGSASRGIQYAERVAK